MKFDCFEIKKKQQQLDLKLKFIVFILIAAFLPLEFNNKNFIVSNVWEKIIINIISIFIKNIYLYNYIIYRTIEF